jgi:spermidine/putrescine transport system permease protein
MEDRRRLSILITPSAIFMLVLFVLPLLIMVVYTFRQGSFGPTSQIFTLKHYRDFGGNFAMQGLLWRSVVQSFWISILSVCLAYPVAYHLSFHAGERKLTLLTIIIVTAWVSFLLRILAWKVLLGGSGAIASLAQWLGLSEEGAPFLIYSQEAVNLTLIYVWIPFVALPIFAALERIDPSLHEAAYDLGCSKLEAFARVTLPLSIPGVVAGFLFVFIPTVGEYVTPSLVGGTTGVMFGNIVRDQFVRALNWPLGSLMSLAMLIVVLIPLVVAARLFKFSDLAGL